MGNSRFLVRFVDVVLILLFGFISISQVQKRSVVTPPESTETQKTPADNVTDVFISITTEGAFLVDNETRSITSMSELYDYIGGKKALYGEGGIKIRIRSDDTAPIQYALAIAEICDDLKVPKALDVRLTNREGASL